MPFRPTNATVFVSANVSLCLGLLGCDNDYPIAPTACDDWCYATQRADCEEDDSPDDCVSECEETALGRQHPECESAWITLSQCYRDAPDSAFSCLDDYSEPENSLCLEERRAGAYCVSERAGLCFDKCVREVEACGGMLADCEYQCSASVAGCETEQLELDRCLEHAPVTCRTDEQPADVPCCEPLVALLRCAGYEGEGCPAG
ncbi:MAG TPA: hypothetical protein VI197_09540 [Polyangiaceae bacterium]